MNGVILLVDDEPHITKAISRALRHDGYQIHSATSAREGLEILAQNPVDVIISDQCMPGMTGSVFLAKVQQSFPNTIRIMLSGYSDFQAVVDAINHGAIYKFWSKPWDSGVLRQQVREAVIESRRLQRGQQYDLMLDSAIEGVITTNAEGLIESVNPAVEIITGYQATELIGQNFFHDCIEFKRQGDFKKISQTVGETGEWRGQLSGIRKDGSGYIQQALITGFRNHRNQVSHWGILLLDITKQKEQQLRVEFLAHHDEITGLPNRRLLNDRLIQALEFRRESNDKLAVISLDIQRIDNLVENLGRSASDGVLKIVAERLEQLIPEAATAACFGGAQFAILLPHIDDVTIPERLVLAILDSFEKPLHFHDNELFLRFNIGLAVAREGSIDAESLLQQADKAKQQAKTSRQLYCIHAATMDSSLNERWILEHALPKAMENNEFFIVYQPKLELATGKTQGMEALLRWEHPDRGTISPEKFIAVAEETGLIIELGKWCLYTACEQTKRWHAQGFDDLCLSVNLSARQMLDPGLFDLVESTLKSQNFPPNLLELEITESTLLHNDNEALLLMKRLRSLGISLAVDDFGTGYASIDYIKRFPFSTLKIDRSFIADITTQPSDTSILESIFMMADSRGLKVTAEGVETKNQLEFLAKKGCDLIQGYFFSRPLNVSDFGEFIKQKVPVQECSSS